jgi:hypothetical protein
MQAKASNYETTREDHLNARHHRGMDADFAPPPAWTARALRIVNAKRRARDGDAGLKPNESTRAVPKPPAALSKALNGYLDRLHVSRMASSLGDENRSDPSAARAEALRRLTMRAKLSAHEARNKKELQQIQLRRLEALFNCKRRTPLARPAQALRSSGPGEATDPLPKGSAWAGAVAAVEEEARRHRETVEAILGRLGRGRDVGGDAARPTASAAQATAALERSRSALEHFKATFPERGHVHDSELVTSEPFASHEGNVERNKVGGASSRLT